MKKKLTPPSLWRARISSFAEYEAFRADFPGELARRRMVEESFECWGESSFLLPGFCAVCAQPTQFVVSTEYAKKGRRGRLVPHWRETMACEYCHLNNRMRGSLHLVRDVRDIYEIRDVYITEQNTEFYRILARELPNLIGSEFLGDAFAPGDIDASGTRHEDVTALSFSNESFDLILSFDVLEHVVDYGAALREFCRILRRGGTLILGVPMKLDYEKSITRAAIVDGNIVHIKPAEYHGEPGGGKILSYYDFGWDIISSVRGAGFSEASVCLWWSQELGYLGGFQYAVLASKAFD